MFTSRMVAFGLAVGVLAAAPARAEEGDARRMPANRDKIGAVLIQRGVVKKSATPEELEAAVSAYLASKAGAEKEGTRLRRKLVDANEAALNAGGSGSIRGRKLGGSTAVPSSTPQFKPLAGEGKLLLVAVDFADAPYTWTRADGSSRTARGPLHNQIARPDNTYDLWRSDFTIGHYESMLFSNGGWTIPEGAYAGQKRISMRDYYLTQSFGRYALAGKAYGWYTVNRPEAYYGDDDPAGDDLLPGTTWDLIRDAVAVINAPGNPNPIPWAEYDIDGPNGEPDCVLDHVLFIHAGVDQSAGGGAQGDDAIWAHSWDVSPPAPVTGPTASCPGGLVISNYTIMPEDGGVGVFAHEFGHDLGLPDEYDTLYTGRGESVQNWSIMSNGSWTGVPAQTEPTSMSIWARYVLGWLVANDNLAVVSLADLGKDGQAFRLEQSSFWGGPGKLNALRVNLPPTTYVYTTPHSGARAFWGGRADLADARLTRSVDLRGRTSASLSFWTWYDVEAGWDFAFVQASTDGGATWASIPFPGTTMDHDPQAKPDIVAELPGLTGRSGGWVQKTVDLSAYAGQQVGLRFRYMTDWGTTGGGFFVDDVAISADGAVVFQDDVEGDPGGWALEGGFTRSNGAQNFARYYLLEWRNARAFGVARGGAEIANPDVGLQRGVQYDPYGSNGGNGNEPWVYRYNSGLVLWLRDTAYAENWTRAHVGHGFLLVVDAHDQAINRPSAGSTAPGVGTYPFNTHVQISDASFSLDRALDFRLGYWGVAKDYSGLNAVPSFDDSLTYWNVKTPDASSLVPRLGFTFRVLGEAADDSAALVGVGRQ